MLSEGYESLYAELQQRLGAGSPYLSASLMHIYGTLGDVSKAQQLFDQVRALFQQRERENYT